MLKTRKEKYVPKGVVVGGLIGLILSTMFIGVGLIAGLLIAQNERSAQRSSSGDS